MPQEPRPNFLGLVGGIVVQHQMDGKIGRNGTIDLLQEFAELDGTMVWPALTDHRSRGDVQRREEAGGAMAFVIVGGPLDTVIADLPWRSRPHLVTQTNHPLGDKTIPPHAHSETGGAQLGGHRGVALPAGTLQNDARTKGQRSRTPRLLQQLPQSDLLFRADNEFSLLRTSSWIRHDPR